VRQKKTVFGGAFRDTDNLASVVDAQRICAGCAGNINRDEAAVPEKKPVECATIISEDADDVATVEDPEAVRAVLAALAASREWEGRAPSGAAGEPSSSAECSAPERRADAAVAEVDSAASWGGASLWTGALLRQRIP